MTSPTNLVTNNAILKQIEQGSRVVDLGCGDGLLLERLRQENHCEVLGVERDEAAFISALKRGVPVIQQDLNAGLKILPSHHFDYAILSQTLQQIDKPLQLLNEIFTIAKRAVVVVPNFGHWKIRLKIALQGRTPITDALPYLWYESPNVHFLSMVDFREMAERGNLVIRKEIPVINDVAVEQALFANVRAQSAIYILEHSECPRA